MAETEKQMRAISWVRSPNDNTRWYPMAHGMMGLPYPMTVHVVDERIDVRVTPCGKFRKEDMITILSFRCVDAFSRYVERNGRPCAASTHHNNVWN